MNTQKTSLGHYDVELTDTFGGQANYGWVTRKTVSITPDLSRLALVRRAKKALEINGLRCKVTDLGDMIELKPYRINAVAFIHYCDYPDCYFLDSSN